MSYVEQEKKTEQERIAFIYSGNEVHHVPEEDRRLCAIGVSSVLARHPHTMLQFTPDQIFASMDNGRAVLALEETELVGFTQLWQYGFTEEGRQILEFGSWLSFRKGLGEKILRIAVELGKEIDPEAQIVAIVEQENVKAQEILIKTGAYEIGNKFSPSIRTVEGQAAFMRIYDITKREGM